MPATIYGILGIQDTNRTVESVGQPVVYDALGDLLEMHTESVNAARATFVGPDTTAPEEIFELPGGGMMQEADRLTRPAAVKRGGRYTIGFPLRDARDQIAADDITLAYMTLRDLQTHIENVFLRHLNWTRFNILKAMLNNVNQTFEDETFSQRLVTVRRLANTDGTIYPPIITGANPDGADDNHYLVSGYTSANISNVNNPFITTKNEVKEHFGEGTIVNFINSAQQSVVMALTDFTEYIDPLVRPGPDVAVITGRAPNVPGVIIGRVNQSWVSVWDFVPADYMITVDLDTPRILRRRLDSVALPGRGVLALVARQQEFPLQESFWRCREGYGVQNRLGAAIMQFKASGTYDIPTGYA